MGGRHRGEEHGDVVGSRAVQAAPGEHLEGALMLAALVMEEPDSPGEPRRQVLGPSRRALKAGLSLLRLAADRVRFPEQLLESRRPRFDGHPSSELENGIDLAAGQKLLSSSGQEARELRAIGGRGQGAEGFRE
jgi:hypothetical protein